MALEKIYDNTIFIFRRDLRLIDNTGLLLAMKESAHVIPIFIFTPAQVSPANKYKSSNAIQFMVESLQDLDEEISKLNKKCQLWTFYGEEIAMLKIITKKLKIDAIYVNEDYTPFSKLRDGKISNYCKSSNIEFKSCTDILLLDTQDIAAKNGNRYHIFTLFYKTAKSIAVRKPIKNIGDNFLPRPREFAKFDLKLIDDFLIRSKFYSINDKIAIRGGRKTSLAILRGIKRFKNYDTGRQNPAYPTSMLSAHNKFGTVSIREAYYALIKEPSGKMCEGLYWRDFYYYINTHFDKFFKYEHLVRKDVKSAGYFKWDNDKRYFNAWKDARTGFPLVDAAMRELNETGFMHNRGRLVVSHFLIKDLIIDWKYGERYFSKRLVDIDRSQNVGNWNWSASWGLDGTPFLRIFNPWTQSKTYDSDCIYIKRWIPELIDVDPKHIHQWDKYHELYPDVKYDAPIVDHAVQRKIFIKRYKQFMRR